MITIMMKVAIIVDAMKVAAIVDALHLLHRLNFDSSESPLLLGVKLHSITCDESHAHKKLDQRILKMAPRKAIKTKNCMAAKA